MDTMQILTAALGAVAQEVAYWYDLRGKLALQKYKDLMESKSYWAVTLAMIAVSAFGTAIWFAGEAQSLRTYLITGAAFPLLLKKGISVLLTPQNRLGGRAQDKNIVRTYFREV